MVVLVENLSERVLIFKVHTHIYICRTSIRMFSTTQRRSVYACRYALNHLWIS